MDRALSVEEKIKRAEEIYARRHSSEPINRATLRVNESSNKKDIKLLKKMIIQILICVLIYMAIYIIQNSQTIFSEQFINKTKEILSYDTNFVEIYENIKNGIITLNNNLQQKEQTNETQEENKEQEPQIDSEQAIGGAVEEQEEQEQVEDTKEETQEEQDINNTKNTTTFIKPIEGTITSIFGYRDTATGSVPKNHTGTDIAANLGTKIKSATDGEVVLASEEGDYGKHLKIQIGEVSIIYAHCNNLYVNQGDKIKQGQEIAEVGSTGNSTGPHLHFEIRYQERIIDPQKILEL